MKRRHVLVLALVAMALPALTAIPPAGAAPDPNRVYVDSIPLYGGTGCPPGTAAPTIDLDQYHFAVVFSALAARTGPGVPITENRTFCQYLVNLHASRGLLSAATVDLVILGRVDLPAGTTASVRSTAYVSGSVLQASAAMAFTAPPPRTTGSCRPSTSSAWPFPVRAPSSP